MKRLSGPAWLAITTSALAIGALPTTVSAQQSDDEADQPLEEIVTIGTRRQGRTAIDTAVPIDVFSQEDLDSVSSDDTLDIIRTLVPSFNVNREPINDGASFVRPPTLRGLDSDKTLVLVNGKRRHRAALVRLGGFGSHGPDLATIPSIAIRSVEVLRDGASALYGSDAIAGVLNFNLKNDAEGGEVRVQMGEYSEGNAQEYLAALNFGFGLGNNGFVNVSAELSERQPTSRGRPYDIGIEGSGRIPQEVAAGIDDGVYDIVDDQGNVLRQEQRFGPDALIEVYDSATGQLVSLRDGSDGIPDDRDTRYKDNICYAEIGQGNCLTQVWGTPNADAIRSFVNAGYDISPTMSLYGFANYSDSNADTSFFHRRPGVSQLLLLRTEDGSVYNPRDRYPAGFTPRFFGNVRDWSFTGGLRGEMDNGLSYDFSGRSGHNEIRYDIRNTMNPSMGPASPRTFRPGNLVTEETEFNADFSTAFDIGMASDLNFAFGFAYRDESYDIERGNEQSFRIGPYAGIDPHNFEITQEEIDAGNNTNIIGTFNTPGCYIPGLQGTSYFGAGQAPGANEGQFCTAGDPIYNTVPVGSNGFPGYGPNFSSAYDRDSWATYVDFETDLTDAFLVNFAARYEDFSDFGDAFTWKVAARWNAGDMFTIRGSAGTGFRAPTPGQISTVNVSTRIADDGTPVAEGIFPPGGPIAGVFGAQPLEDESSTQYTLGIAATPIENLTLTLDYYFIELEDRIVLSSDFTVGPEEVAALEALGVPGANTIAQVSFFANDVTSETSGIDFVASYNMDWAAGNTLISFAGNWNDTEITEPGQFLNAETVFDEENGQPEFRANLTGRHTWGDDITFTLRMNYYGEYKNTNDPTLTQTQTLGSIAQFDADVTWDLGERYRLTIGGDNIFDEYPDQLDFENCCGQVYPNGVVPWQGSFWYIRGAIQW